MLVKLYRGIRQLVEREYHEGLYEVLEYDATLELLDPQGQTALFRKRQRVRYLQDYVIAFQDFAWGDGNVLAAYQCTPGVVVDRYREGDRWNVLISLRETRSVGDIDEFHIQRKIIAGFTASEEWWQGEMQNRTRHLKLSIIFPLGRRCQRAILCERNVRRTTSLGATFFTTLPDGRQLLTWETSRPRRFETYTLKWQW